MRVLKYFLFSLLFLSSCDKFEWHNPYDPECPKELFTPSSPGATMEGNSVKLTWLQENDDISGFALFRSAEGEPITNLTQIQKSATQYLDASVTPGKKYTYYVLAVAGTNKSDTIKAEITPVFPITINTGAVTELAATSAKVSGNITNAGGGTVTSRGICWSTTQNPTVSNSKTTEGTGTGEYISTLSGLLAATTYYARAYGENSRGIVYGSQVTFTTLGPPILTTTAVSNITATSATSGGTIISDGGSPITAKGIVWSTSPNPTIALTTKTDDGTGVGAFISALSNLTNNTKYYIRAYATNIVGTSYGEEVSLNTQTPIFDKLKEGLVAYYPFNGNPNDESGNQNHGINFGAVLTSDRFGNFEKAYSFNGVSNKIEVTTSLKSFSTMTISAWFLGGNYILDGRTPDFPTRHIYLNIEPFGAGTVYQSLNLGSIQERLNSSKWNHIIAHYENGLGKLYLNGNLIYQENFFLTPQQMSYDLLKIGCNFVDSQFFIGMIDDIRIYNRALTQEEITYLANN